MAYQLPMRRRTQAQAHFYYLMPYQPPTRRRTVQSRQTCPSQPYQPPARQRARVTGSAFSPCAYQPPKRRRTVTASGKKEWSTYQPPTRRRTPNPTGEKVRLPPNLSTAYAASNESKRFGVGLIYLSTAYSAANDMSSPQGCTQVAQIGTRSHLRWLHLQSRDQDPDCTFDASVAGTATTSVACVSAGAVCAAGLTDAGTRFGEAGVFAFTGFLGVG